MTALLVLNQSQSPAFQQMIENASAPASVWFLTAEGVEPSRPDVTTLKAPRYQRRSAAARAASWVAYAGVAFMRARTLAPNLVLAVTNPPFIPHVAWAVQKLGGAPYGLLIWDIYPDHLHHVGVISESHPLSRAWVALNRRALAHAEFVVTISEGMAQKLRDQLAGVQAKIKVIPNWSDTEQLRPIPRANNPWARELGVTDELVVMYSGNLGATHGLDGLLGAAAHLADNPGVRFLIIGRGLGRATVEREVARRGLRNIRIMDPVPWSELNYSLALADVAVVSQAPGTEHLSIPSKTYSALAAGSAILALTGRESDLSRLVTRTLAGHVREFSDSAGIARVLEEWQRDRSALDHCKVAARTAAVSSFSLGQITSQWQETLAPYL